MLISYQQNEQIKDRVRILSPDKIVRYEEVGSNRLNVVLVTNEILPIYFDLPMDRTIFVSENFTLQGIPNG